MWNMDSSLADTNFGSLHMTRCRCRHRHCGAAAMDISANDTDYNHVEKHQMILIIIT